MRSLVTPRGMLVCIVGVPRAPRDRDAFSSGAGPVSHFRSTLGASLNSIDSYGRDDGCVSDAPVRASVCISGGATPFSVPWVSPPTAHRIGEMTTIDPLGEAVVRDQAPNPLCPR